MVFPKKSQNYQHHWLILGRAVNSPISSQSDVGNVNFFEKIIFNKNLLRACDRTVSTYREILLHSLKLDIWNCSKSVGIRSFFGTYFPAFEQNAHSLRMRENTDQKNCKYGHISRSVGFAIRDLIYAFGIHSISRFK